MFYYHKLYYTVFIVNCNENIILFADEQSKSHYTTAIQGQGQLVLYTGLRHQTNPQHGSVEEGEVYYILPANAVPREQNTASV